MNPLANPLAVTVASVFKFRVRDVFNLKEQLPPDLEWDIPGLNKERFLGTIINLRQVFGARHNSRTRAARAKDIRIE